MCEYANLFRSLHIVHTYSIVQLTSSFRVSVFTFPTLRTTTKATATTTKTTTATMRAAARIKPGNDFIILPVHGFFCTICGCACASACTYYVSSSPCRACTRACLRAYRNVCSFCEHVCMLKPPGVSVCSLYALYAVYTVPGVATNIRRTMEFGAERAEMSTSVCVCVSAEACFWSRRVRRLEPTSSSAHRFLESVRVRECECV